VKRDFNILLGKTASGDYLWLPGGEHAILQARRGAGKSVGGSIPNACLDIKRELFRHTAGWRAKQGHEGSGRKDRLVNEATPAIRRRRLPRA
jgi:type IV secretory pathway TraG/TraD family ATPase VirD4